MLFIRSFSCSRVRQNHRVNFIVMFIRCTSVREISFVKITVFFSRREKYKNMSTTKHDFIVNCPFQDGDVPRSTSYGVYVSQLIRVARVSSHVDDFNTREKVLTAKLHRHRNRYHKLQKAFSKFYLRHFNSVSKYIVGLKTLLLQGFLNCMLGC